MVCKVKKCDGIVKNNEKHRKGLWSPEEDETLRNYVLKHGHGCWSTLPIKAGLKRNGKSCRLRWVNYLRPGLKKGVFTKEEEDTVLALHNMLGNKWSQISKCLPGRTDNEIKNYWHSYLKKRIALVEETTSFANYGSQGKVSNSQVTSYSSTSPTNSFETLTKTQTSLQNTMGRSSQTGAREQMNPQISSFSPKIMFAEWLSSDLVTNGPSQESQVQDCLMNEERFDEAFNQCYSEIGSIDNVVPDSYFWSNDEASENQFCNSFSDNIIIQELHHAMMMG